MFRYMFSSFLAQLIHPKMGHPNYHFAKLFYIFPEAFPLPFSSVSILPWFFCCGPPRRVWSSHCHPWSWDGRPHDIPWFLEAGRNREPTELGQPGYDQIVRQIPALICHFTLCKFAQPRTTFLGDLLCQNVESMFFSLKRRLSFCCIMCLLPYRRWQTEMSCPIYAPRQSRHGRTNFVILERHLEHGVPPGVQILHLEVH